MKQDKLTKALEEISKILKPLMKETKNKVNEFKELPRKFFVPKDLKKLGYDFYFKREGYWYGSYYLDDVKLRKVKGKE